MPDKPKLPNDLASAFEYLDDLRDSGVTNMFGARPYVQRAMGYSSEVAGAVLSAWMGSFDGETTSPVRAAKCLAESPTP